jgi:tagatose-1,6-bisphosphate aldolase non-catalytic subunit AgaZ/GatZ
MVALNDFPEIVFEGHSTDFQTLRSLSNLVACGFGFVKVGPELTFAFREAMFAMASIEGGFKGLGDSNIVRAVERAMDENPGSWRSYIPAGPSERVDRLFGLSDRVRYYWPYRAVARAVTDLKTRTDSAQISPGLVSQFAGRLDDSDGTLSLSERLVQSRVGAVVARYRAASRRAANAADISTAPSGVL